MNMSKIANGVWFPKLMMHQSKLNVLAEMVHFFGDFQVIKSIFDFIILTICIWLACVCLQTCVRWNRVFRKQNIIVSRTCTRFDTHVGSRTGKIDGKIIKNNVYLIYLIVSLLFFFIYTSTAIEKQKRFCLTFRFGIININRLSLFQHIHVKLFYQKKKTGTTFG